MGKQNWNIFEVNFQLVYKIMSIFGLKYTSLLKYTSECNNFSKITSLSTVSVENKNESVKSLSRGRAKHFQCNFELKRWSCNDSIENGE